MGDSLFQYQVGESSIHGKAKLSKSDKEGQVHIQARDGVEVERTSHVSTDIVQEWLHLITILMFMLSRLQRLYRLASRSLLLLWRSNLRLSAFLGIRSILNIQRPRYLCVSGMKPNSSFLIQK